MPSPALPTALSKRVLHRLGFAGWKEATPASLTALYAAWCQKVPFDNVQKLIYLRNGSTGPLPGATAEHFFETWLQHGTGGTCWAGAGALASLLTSLGFQAQRGIATMLVAPDLPPNHGTVLVNFASGESYLVDTSILHHAPLPLHPGGISSVAHPAWGIQATRPEVRWHLHWRPLHVTGGFTCRLEQFERPQLEFEDRHEQTRGWSPFNYQLSARINRGEEVVGLAFGSSVILRADGSVVSNPVNHEERVRFLSENFELSEAVLRALPQDQPTPPPPTSRRFAAEAAGK